MEPNTPTPTLAIGSAGGTYRNVPAKKWAAPGDWDGFRLQISHMYLEQGKTLKEIMEEMGTRHNFHGTRRMYQKRLSAWGLNKNKREEDMLFIVAKIQKRESVGKQTSFTVRGKAIAKEEVVRYFLRKGGVVVAENPEASPPSTPTHISYGSPAPQPAQSPPISEIDNMPGSLFKQESYILEASSALSTMEYSRDCYNSSESIESFPTKILPGGYFFSCVAANEAQRIFAPDPDICRPLSPAQVYLLPEELIRGITVYFDGFFHQSLTLETLSNILRNAAILTLNTRSFGNGTFIANEKGDCVNVNMDPESFVRLIKFYNYCFAGATLLENRSFAEARRMLSNACGLIKPILESEHSRTLDCFFETFLTLKEQAYSDVLNLLRAYIANMASTLAATGRLGKPLARICRLIGLLDTEQLEGALIQSWNATCVSFAKNLGPFHRTTIRCYNEYLLQIFKNDPAGRVDAFRKILAECQKDPARHQQTLNLLAGLAQSLGDAEQYLEKKIVAQDLLSRVRAAAPHDSSSRQEGMALDHLVKGSIGLRDFPAVEKYQRELIEAYTKGEGESHPTVVKHWTRLGAWLREWGREEEADLIKRKITILTGHDEIDEEVAALLQDTKLGF